LRKVPVILASAQTYMFAADCWV